MSESPSTHAGEIEYAFRDFSEPAALEAAQCCDSLSLDGIDGVLSTHAEDHQAFYEAGEDYDAVLAKVENELDLEAATKALIYAASQQRKRRGRARQTKLEAGDEGSAESGGAAVEEAEL